AVLARNLGKNLEPNLWASWGGSPTTQLLRYRGPANPLMRERWHAVFSKLLGRPLPTLQEEVENPSAADAIYEAAVKLQISKTRDSRKYSLLLKENTYYGFCRNLLGLRPTGILIAVG